MVAIDSTTEATPFYPQTPLPLVTSRLKSSLHSSNVRPIILSAAGVGVCIALGLFVLICWKARKSILGGGIGRAQFVVQTTSDVEEKEYNKLKPLKLLCPKAQIFPFEKHTINTHVNPQLANPQDKTHCFPNGPRSSLCLDRLHHSRHRNSVLPPRPIPAFTIDLIPALCSPPSTSPKEIFEWIQSDSVLSSHDGYARAREDSRLCIVSTETQDSSQANSTSKTKTTYALTQGGRMPMSIFSSSTLNKTSSRGQPMLGDLSSSNRMHHHHLGYSSLRSHNHSGATRIPSISHLKECHLGPLEQGTRWGSLWHTFEKPTPSRVLKRSPQRPGREGKEN